MCVFAPKGFSWRSLLVDNFEHVDELGRIFNHPMDDRVVWGYCPSDAILGVQFQCPHMPLDLLNGFLNFAIGFLLIPLGIRQ